MNNLQKLAIQEGIKTVGIGKKGSKPLEKDLIEKIIKEIKSRTVPDAIRGAFFVLSGNQLYIWPTNI